MRGGKLHNKYCGNFVQRVKWPQCHTYATVYWNLCCERPVSHIHIHTNNKTLWRQTPPPHKHKNQASTKNQAGRASQKPLRASNGSEASSIQGVGADWRSGPESCQALIMRWASGDRQREDGFFIDFADNEKVTKLQVIENMPEIMQLKKSNSTNVQNKLKRNETRKETESCNGHWDWWCLKRPPIIMHLQMFKSFYFLVEKILKADSRGFMTIFFPFCFCINLSL